MSKLKNILDPFDAWESAMADISRKLLVKYGLEEVPTQQKSADWLKKTEEFIKEGIEKNQAGELAAKAIFRDYRTRVYASQADTIEMLLNEAAKK